MSLKTWASGQVPRTSKSWSYLPNGQGALHRHREVLGSNPVKVLTFSGFYMQLLNCILNCDDHGLLDWARWNSNIFRALPHSESKSLFLLLLRNFGNYAVTRVMGNNHSRYTYNAVWQMWCVHLHLFEYFNNIVKRMHLFCELWKKIILTLLVLKLILIFKGFYIDLTVKYLRLVVKWTLMGN